MLLEQTTSAAERLAVLTQQVDSPSAPVQVRLAEALVRAFS